MNELMNNETDKTIKDYLYNYMAFQVNKENMTNSLNINGIIH